MGVYSARHNATLSARRRSKAPAGPNDKVFASLFQKAAGDKRGRRPLLFCAARRKTRAKRAEIRSAQQKRPCQPKTAKRFFGGPGSQGPSGQAKERTRILPVRRGFSAPGVPRHMAGWPFLRGWPLLCWLLCPVPRRFFCKRCIRAGILWHRLSCLSALCRGHRFFFAAFSREAHGGISPFSAVFRRFVPGLRAAFLPPLRRLLRLFVWPALPLPAVRFVCAVPSCFGCLFACSALFMWAFSLLFFCPFLPNFFLSNLFSFVAQASAGFR